MSKKKRESIPTCDPSWGLFDSHAHLDFLEGEAVQGVLDRAREAGVTDVLIPATGLESLKKALSIHSESPRLHVAVGIHPHEAEKQSGELDKIAAMIQNDDRLRAVGEIGLDDHYDFAPREKQREIFRRQLKIAKENKKPVIIHCREAEEDTITIIEEIDIHDGVMHCFSGSQELADWAVARGFYVSFSGVVTFTKSEDLRTIAKTIPLEQLMIETDAPYLAPQERRGKQNEPAFVAFTAKTLAEITGHSIETIVRQTGENARRLFHVSEESQQ